MERVRQDSPTRHGVVGDGITLYTLLLLTMWKSSKAKTKVERGGILGAMNYV